MSKNKYIVNKKVDYLALTFDEKPERYIIGNPHVELERAPNKNYNKAYKTDLGAIVMYSTTDLRVGTHVILSGSTLDLIRGDGHKDVEIAEWAMKTSKNISRVDVAVTSYREDGKAHELLPTAIHNLANSKHLKSRMKPEKGVINDETIETAYVGSRLARNRLFRAYDKGIDLGLDANRIIRFELETQKSANHMTNAIASGLDLGSIIRRYVDFPSIALWVEILAENSAKMPHLEELLTPEDVAANKRANRWYWLMVSVAPALARALYEDVQINRAVPEDIFNNENMRLFTVQVRNKLDELFNEDMREDD